MHEFQYSLERNLYELFQDLNSGGYQHGGYRKFIVNENKRREISVAGIRDRVVHRMIYDYLVKIYDKTFIYDAWSCRKGKGLHGAVERTQGLLKRGMNSGACYKYATPTRRRRFSWVWKCDVRKFFDNIDHELLLRIISRRTKDSITRNLLKEVIYSYTTVHESRIGIPIGNLTSQIFANIYMNELDRFVKNSLRVKSYVRYGDDFIIIENDPVRLEHVRAEVVRFLAVGLKLQVNANSDKIMKVTDGLKFLGVKIWLSGMTLNKRNQARVYQRLGTANVSSYIGLVRRYGTLKQVNSFNWAICEKVIKATD